MKKSLSLKLSYVLQKLRRRMPARLQSASGWLLAQDWLVARHHLAGARRRLLAERWAGCGTEEEWFDFAREVFPSHQIRTEILEFSATRSRSHRAPWSKSARRKAAQIFSSARPCRPCAPRSR
jgi:hypothetical protein